MKHLVHRNPLYQITIKDDNQQRFPDQILVKLVMIDEILQFFLS